METKKTRLFALLACLFMLFANHVQAQGTDDLQEFIDNLAKVPATRAGTPTDIDLSAYSEPRTTTLYIRNGVNVRFINGTLTRSQPMTTSLVEIKDKSRLEVAETATIYDKKFSESSALVNVSDGELEVTGGKIESIYEILGHPGPHIIKPFLAVTLSNQSTFNISSGYISIIKNEGCKMINISGGEMAEIISDEPIRFSGNAKVSDKVTFTSMNGHLIILSSLKSNITLAGYQSNQCIAKGIQEYDTKSSSWFTYSIIESDLQKILLNSDNFILSLEGNFVYVRDNSSNPIQRYDDVEPGTLPSRIPENAQDIIEELTLTGKLNGTDIVLLQDMAKKKLRKLDIFGCDIVKGGSAYYTSSDSYATKYYTANDEIGSSMFYKSTSLETVILPNSITKLAGSSFHYGSVKSITIGSKVNTINGGLCPGTRLEEIILNGNSMFALEAGILYDVMRTTIYKAVVSVSGEITIPSSVGVIENSAFDQCGKITKVILPSNLKKVETGCFDDCTSLAEVVFNSNLSYLGYNCFSGCSALKTIDLSNTKVTYIYQSFYNCNAIETLLLPTTLETIWGTCFTSTKLSYISCPAVNPPTLEHPGNAFRYSNIKNFCKVVVPNKSLSAYKAAIGWNEFLKYESDIVDPNLIHNEEQLRTRLKEIAGNKESSASKPIKLTMAPEGFNISSSILISDCFVEFTGGRLTISQNTNHSPFMIFGNSGLTLDNIEIDFNKYDSYYRGFDVNSGGKLTIGKGAMFLNAVSNEWYRIPFYSLYGGTTTISPTSNNVENEVFSIQFQNFKKNALLQFTSSVNYARIIGNWDEFDSNEPYTLIKGSGYTLKESDFKNMNFESLPSNLEVYYDGNDYSVKIRKDSNYITDEDWLQKRLDEIVTSSNKKEELTIAEKGITLTKGVYVRAGTSVTLKGGTISLADSFNDNAAFYLEREAYLTYNDIKINLRNVYLPTSFVQSLAFSYLNILDNVEFTNVYNGPKAMTKGFFYCYINISPKNSIFSIEVNRGSVIYGLGPEIILRNCSLKSNGGYPTIAGDGAVYMYDYSQVFGDGNASSVIDLPRGFLSMFYGENTLVHADNNGNVVNVENGELSSGKFEGSEATFNSVKISDNFDFDISQLTLIGNNTGDIQISGNASLPRVYVMNGVLIKLTSAMTDTWIIDGDWSNFGVENPYTLISGYNYKITEADYSRMQFANLPDDIEAVYNDDLKVVQLQKRAKECDLQSLIDGLCDAGKNVPVPEGVTDIGCEEIDFLDPLQCIVDRSFDGGNETDETGKPIKTICLCGSGPQIQIVRINKYSSLTISNYNISSSKFENQYFQVYGTLIIDVNVHIYHFIRFIHIMPGGRVIWRGGYTEDVDEIVHNEGGTLEIEGDFDNGGKPFVNPAGSTLIIRDGTFNIDIENYGILIIKGGYVKGKIKNYGEFNMSGGTVNGGGERDIYNYDGGKVVIYNGSDIGGGTGCIWSETDVWIEGGVQVTDIHIKRGCRIHVIGKLTVIWNIHFFVFDDFNVYVPFIFGDEGYQLTKEDFANLRIDLPDAYRWEYYDGVVVIVRIPYDVMTIVEYLDYFGPHGNLDHPWSFIYNKTNININIDWHILRDYHLIFDGGTFTMNGSIYIDEGASLWLKNIRFKGVGHHIYVYGTLYIDENVDFAEMVKFIHICKGGKIRFVTQPTYIVNIFISEENIETYKSIISDIKEEWLQFINIELPDGYRWIFIDGTIVIVRIPYDVVTLVEFLDFFGPQGTPGYPWSFIYNTTNININIDWHILRDYHLIFDGGTFTMNGGDIYIDEGASLWLKNIRFKGFDRHIYVYGTLYIDENVDFAEIVKFIHICKGGEIRFVTKPAYVVNIIIEEEHILTDVAVIYDIITEWLEYLHIDLPEGYEWKYDDDTHTITISFASGINNILVDESGDEPVYDMSGKRQLKPRKGLNIIKGKKVVVR